MESDNQNNSKPWLWKKGQSGNPKGRPKGKTMKEYVREYLERMTDEERDEWLEGLPKELVWKMAEGNPKESNEVSIKELPTPILGYVPTNLSNKENNANVQEDTGSTGGDISE